MSSLPTAALSELAARWWPDLQTALEVPDRTPLPGDELYQRLRTLLLANAATFYRERRDPVTPTVGYDRLGEQARKFYRQPDDEDTLVVATDGLRGLSQLLGPIVHCRLNRAARRWRLWRPDALSTSTRPRTLADPCPLTSRLLRELDRTVCVGGVPMLGADVLKLVPQAVRSRRAYAEYLNFDAQGQAKPMFNVAASRDPLYRVCVALSEWLPAFRAFDDCEWRFFVFRSAALDAVCLIATDGRRLMTAPGLGA